MKPFSKSHRKGLLAIATGRIRNAQRRGTLTGVLFDSYRPELHYMRGPGPKWREKHARAVALAG